MFLQNLSLLTIRSCIASCSNASSQSSCSRCTGTACETIGTSSSCRSHGTRCTCVTRCSCTSRGSQCPCNASGSCAAGNTRITFVTFNEQRINRILLPLILYEASNAFVMSVHRRYSRQSVRFLTRGNIWMSTRTIMKTKLKLLNNHVMEIPTSTTLRLYMTQTCTTWALSMSTAITQLSATRINSTLQLSCALWVLRRCNQPAVAADSQF